MKLLAKLNEKRKNNKGFTLVELIIVVAIIAVLAAVLAPQYIRYVERSRESNDLQVATNIMRATTAAVADPHVEAPANATYEITWDTSGSPAANTLSVTSTTPPARSAEVIEAVAAIMGWPVSTTAGVYTGEAAQSAAGTGVDFVFTIDVATGQIEVATASAAWETTIGVNP